MSESSPVVAKAAPEDGLEILAAPVLLTRDDLILSLIEVVELACVAVPFLTPPGGFAFFFFAGAMPGVEGWNIGGVPVLRAPASRGKDASGFGGGGGGDDAGG